MVSFLVQKHSLLFFIFRAKSTANRTLWVFSIWLFTWVVFMARITVFFPPHLSIYIFVLTLQMGLSASQKSFHITVKLHIFVLIFNFSALHELFVSFVVPNYWKFYWRNLLPTFNVTVKQFFFFGKKSLFSFHSRREQILIQHRLNFDTEFSVERSERDGGIANSLERR